MKRLHLPTTFALLALCCVAQTRLHAGSAPVGTGGEAAPVAAAPTPVETRELLSFQTYIDRKSKDLTITLTNTSSEALQFHADALRHPILTGSYVYHLNNNERVTESWSDQADRAEVAGRIRWDEVVTLPPGEAYKSVLNITPWFEHSKALHAATLAKRSHNQITLYLSFINLLAPLPPGEPTPVVITRGPSINLGSSNKVWPETRSKRRGRR